MVQGQSVDSYVFMLHMFEHFEFPVSPLGVDGRLEGSCQLFDGHFFCAILSFINTAKSTSCNEVVITTLVFAYTNSIQPVKYSKQTQSNLHFVFWMFSSPTICELHIKSFQLCHIALWTLFGSVLWHLIFLSLLFLSNWHLSMVTADVFSFFIVIQILTIIVIFQCSSIPN